MPVTLNIKPRPGDPSVQKKRRFAANRVVRHFGNRLPDLRLACLLDDTDCEDLKKEVGETNRGLFLRVNRQTESALENIDWSRFPISTFIIPGSPPDWKTDYAFDAVIYLHGSTCSDETALAMTLSHELQHFIQYGFNRKLWAVNYLLARLPKDVIDITGLNWPDITTEREARIVAKRIGIKVCGSEAIEQYIARKITEFTSLKDLEDWRFSQDVDPSVFYDLASETESIFERSKSYRQYLEQVLDEMRKDEDFKNLDLSEYFEN